MNLDVQSVWGCIFDYLQMGKYFEAWHKDPARKLTLEEARQALLEAGVELGGSLDSGGIPNIALESAVFLDYSGDDFDIWLDFLWEWPRWGEDYIAISSNEWESYSQMTVADSALLRPRRIYFDVTDLDQEGAGELLLWLAYIRKDVAYDFSQERNVGLFNRPPSRPRGRPKGVLGEESRREVMPGYTWTRIAREIKKDPRRRRGLKARYIKHQELESDAGRIASDDPAKNFDEQVRRQLKRLGEYENSSA